VRAGLFLLISFIFLNFSDATTRVRVRINKSTLPIKVSGYQLKSDFYKNKNNLLKKDKLLISRVFKNGVWSWSIEDLETKKEVLSEKPSLIFTGDFMLLNNKMDMPPKFEVYGFQNRMDIVVNLEIEKYLLGVISNEMPLSWPEEAIKAQVVASRSYTLSLLKDRMNLHFDVDSTVQDQVFSWLSEKKLNHNLRAKLINAISETVGEYLSYNKIKVYRAYFHANSGGKTEPANLVWGGRLEQPSFSVSTELNNNELKNWKKFWDKRDIAKVLELPVPHIDKLTIDQKSPSGRVLKVKIVYKNREWFFLGDDFRRRLGYDQIKSTLFKIEESKEGFLLYGRGYGHGVGMCQWGARHLAQQGLDYREILNYYYPKTFLVSYPISI
jgi:stage II sporulation protein D